MLQNLIEHKVFKIEAWDGKTFQFQRNSKVEQNESLLQHQLRQQSPFSLRSSFAKSCHKMVDERRKVHNDKEHRGSRARLIEQSLLDQCKDDVFDRVVRLA